MAYVRENYDRFLLALIAFGLFACSGLFLHRTRNLDIAFLSLNERAPHGTSLPGIDPVAVKNGAEKLSNPDMWNTRVVNDSRIPLFVSVRYITENNHLVDPLGGTDLICSPSPIPRRWLIDHNQDLLSPNVVEQDTDGDGFTTLDEYLSKTDPTDRDSHPPYWTKLAFVKLIHIPSRLRFEGLRSVAGDGDNLLINTLDDDHPVLYLKIGQMVVGTRYKIVKFEAKTEKIKGITKDVSEVTLENQETHEQIVLVKGREVDSPITYAVLNYTWTGKTFAVKRNQELTLKPEDNIKYKCVDVNEMEVRILKEDDQKEIRIRVQKPDGQ